MTGIRYATYELVVFVSFKVPNYGGEAGTKKQVVVVPIIFSSDCFYVMIDDSMKNMVLNVCIRVYGWT